MPRTAGWGYPEPYTRDMMVSSLGLLLSGDDRMVDAVRQVLQALAHNQTPRGHIPSLAHDPDDRGASDTTPWFLIGLALYRRFTGEKGLLEEAAQRALTWMQYQSPDDRGLVAQQPTSDWRDEQWVLGYGLYVNSLVHTYLVLYGRHEEAQTVRRLMNRLEIRGERKDAHVHEGLVVPHRPYYALWAYKVHASERFDLLGNCLAVLSGVASASRARRLATWIEEECDDLRRRGDLAMPLSPCLFPYIRPGDPDWHSRYERYGQPGDYHNGGVWPFIAGFHVAALIAAGRERLARQHLEALAEAVRPARRPGLEFGFAEWLRAQDGEARGQEWQTWSAAMFVYAAACVERCATPFFDDVRRESATAPAEE
ncbi:MAG: amylo-alpha-1,6-glucosidase [Anaerolineae bacterium]|nr:amylo-alpha-1,6-glucosidase [Anaerolineae bacterium]